MKSVNEHLKKSEEINESAKDFVATFDRNLTITIKKGHTKTDENTLMNLYSDLGNLIKKYGLEFKEIIVK